MGRILALDVGRKRTGVAVTDPQQIIATALTTVPTGQLFEFLEAYLAQNPVDYLVVGMPVQMNNTPSEAVKYVQPVLNRLAKRYPQLPVRLADERFTSMLAFQTMIDAGLSRSQRRNKGLVDALSATIMLQSHMASREFNSNTQ